MVGYTGSIRLGYSLLGTSTDVELSSVSEQSLTGAVTVVGARSHLFAGTLRQNLMMAKPDATDNDLWGVLHQARIDDFVCAQPGGLDMRIEQDAANLSGGQRQRFAIARALLRDSAVYVFDEATSSVDVDSESRILATIRDLADRKTVLMITHRVANAFERNSASRRNATLWFMYCSAYRMMPRNTPHTTMQITETRAESPHTG